MARTAKRYNALTSYLESMKEDAITLSFSQIERIIGSPLPACSATAGRRWWSNNEDHRAQAAAWRRAGWRVSGLKGRLVEFTRD